jgi:hypothetical protein
LRRLSGPVAAATFAEDDTAKEQVRAVPGPIRRGGGTWDIHSLWVGKGHEEQPQILRSAEEHFAQRLSVLSREVEVGYGKDGALRLGKRRGARFPLSHNLGCGEQSLTFHEPGN